MVSQIRWNGYFTTTLALLESINSLTSILREKCPYLEFFLSAFSPIRTEYGEIRSIRAHFTQYHYDFLHPKSHTASFYISNLFIHFQFIYRWQILIQLTIWLAFHKQQDLSQTSGAVNNIVKCWYRWHQTYKTESQFVLQIKVNTKQNRNAKRRYYAHNWKMTLYHYDLIKTLTVNATARYIWKYL